MIRYEVWSPVLCGSVFALAAAGAATAQVRSFDIPAGDLKAALDIYIQQSGVQLIYRSDDVRGKKTSGVHAALSAEDALNRLLAGSEFVAARDPSGAVVIVVRTMGAADSGAKASSAASAIDTVVVTARKRAEDLLKAPVPVSVLSAKDISQRGIETMGDVATFTPGLTDDQTNAAGSRSDRSFQALIVRGMTPSTASSPTTSVFINGVPVSSADLVQNIDDFDRVEVLKGPQSAYFGRETFAGAVNIVTRAPSNSFGGSLGASLGTRNSSNFAGFLTGPIIPHQLTLLAGASYDHHDGSYHNAAEPGQLLGSQTTKSAHVAVTAHPIDNLTVKAFGMILQDDDGPAATGDLLTGASAAPGGVAPPAQFVQSNCTVNSLPFFCGTLPGQLPSSPAQNSALTPSLHDYLAQDGKLIPSNKGVKGFGLRRDAYHVDLNIEYALPSLGLTLTSLSGFNYDDWSEVSDLSNIDGAANGPYPGYPGYPFLVENVAHDASQEFRLTTDQTKPLRSLLGVSYVSSLNQSGIGGPQYGGFFSAFVPTRSNTGGIFFSLAYNVTKQLTVNFEGRYQIDDESEPSFQGSMPFAAKYYNFLPRLIIQYNISPDVMAYWNYSEGANPGTFNGQVAGLGSSLSQNTYKYFTGSIQGGYDASVVVQPEKLSNLEFGLKGKFLDGRATLSADIYYDDWTNQLVSRSVTLPPSFASGGALINPTNIPQLVGWTDNSGKSTMKGVEFDSKLAPVDHLIFNASAAVNDARYDHYSCIPCATYPSAQPVDSSGKSLPYASKYSATVGVQYSKKIDIAESLDWFVRVDYVYKSGVYFDSLNTGRTPDINLFNLHVGLNWISFNIEGYVNNIFNNKSYTNAFSGDNFQNFTGYFNAVRVGLPNLQTFGAKLRYRF